MNVFHIEGIDIDIWCGQKKKKMTNIGKEPFEIPGFVQSEPYFDYQSARMCMICTYICIFRFIF